MAFWPPNGHLEQAPMQERRQEERPTMPQAQSTAAARQLQGGFVGNGQNFWGGYNTGVSHAFTGSFEAQPAVNSRFDDAYYANGDGGAFPVSASPHPSVPSAATTHFGTNDTTHTTSASISNASQPTISRFPDGVSSGTAGPGPTLASSTFNAPSPFAHTHVGPADFQRNMTSPSVAVPPSTKHGLPAASDPPKPVSVQRKPLPSQRQQFVHSTGTPSRGTAAGKTATAQAKAQPIASTSRANSQSSSNTQRPSGPPNDIPALKPALAPALDRKPNNGSSSTATATGTNKPLLKMRRTGQNFPLSSAASSSPIRMTSSLHQRTNSGSPIGRSGPGYPSTAVRKATDSVPGKAAVSSLAGNETSTLATKPRDTRADPVAPIKAPTSGRTHRSSIVLSAFADLGSSKLDIKSWRFSEWVKSPTYRDSQWIETCVGPRSRWLECGWW